MKLPRRIHDLTQPIYHNCPGWPGQRLATVEWRYQQVNDKFNSEYVDFNTHTATHIDAPYHFLADGKTVDQMPLDAFAGPAAFLDLRKTVKPDTAITPDDLMPHMGGIDSGDIVILCTGYGKLYGFSHEYLHTYPYLGGPAAELLASAGVKLVGTDALSLGGWGGDEKGHPCHLALLPKNICILEGLFIPDEILDGEKRYFSCFPLLINGCGGAPARAVAYDFD